MKSFKQFLKVIAPILVDVDPVHGSHAAKTKAPIVVDVDPVHGSHASKESLKESFKASSKGNVEHGMTGAEFHEKHGMSDYKWKKINSSYSPHGEDDHHKPLKTIKEYSENSHINHQLIQYTKGKASIFGHHEEMKNHPYYGKKEKFEESKKKAVTQIRHLDHAISSNKLKSDATVYHGCGFKPHEYASKHPDRHIQLPAYTSTSSSSHIAKDFAHPHFDENSADKKDEAHVLRIHLKKGHEALPILHRSVHNHEHEILLHRNTKLKIADKPSHSVDHGHKVVHFWDAHPVK